jgi:hypothetical protein
VRGVPRLSGDEAAEHGPTNHFELRWADAAELAEFGIYPVVLRELLAELLAALLAVGNEAGQA